MQNVLTLSWFNLYFFLQTIVSIFYTLSACLPAVARIFCARHIFGGLNWSRWSSSISRNANKIYPMP